MTPNWQFILSFGALLSLVSCVAGPARSQVHDIEVHPITVVEIESGPDDRLIVYAEFRNQSDRPVCLHQNQLPEGSFNEAIFRISAEGGSIVPFRPGLPYEWPEKYIFIPSGSEMKLFAMIDGQYDLQGLNSFSIMVSLFGYYCSFLEEDVLPPYISPEGIWTIEEAPRRGVVSFRSSEVVYSRLDEE